MARYGMVVDLKKCTGCQTCVAACKAEHNTPTGMFQTTVRELEYGVFPHSVRVFVSILCNHCEKPTCVDVCPSNATYKRNDGIVMIDYQRCIGCAACVEHCPYQAREYVRDNRILYPDGVTEFERPTFDKIPMNAPLKCDFCFHRVDKGEPPVCVAVCPTKARVFGDLEDSNSEVNQIREKFDGWPMMPEADTRPSVFYVGEQRK